MELEPIEVFGIVCLAVGISWLLALFACWLRGDFDYIFRYSFVIGLYEAYYEEVAYKVINRG
jgi:hypothetical protein